MNAVSKTKSENDEIDLGMIGSILRGSPAWVFGTPVALAILTFIALSLQTSLWEARARIRLGQIAETAPIVVTEGYPDELTHGPRDERSDQQKPTTDCKVALPASTRFVRGIEPSPQTIEKLKAAYPALKVLPPHETRSIELVLRAPSPEKARAELDSIVQELEKTHAEMAKPSIQHLQAQLALAKKDAESDRTGKFRQEVLSLEEMLDARWTYPTALEGKIEVTDAPVYPQRAWSLVMALLSGLLIGCLVPLTFHFLRATLRRENA